MSSGLAACGDSTEPLATAKPGVIFSYPIDGQNDVPVGSRIVVTFSQKVTASALGPCTATSGAFCVVGPNGPVDAMPTVSDDGTSVSFEGPLDAGAVYQVFARSELAPFAENLPSGALFSFTTRSDRPKAAAPTLVSINGGDPTKIGTSFRPMFETTTLRLLFSEPLDPRSIKMGAGGFELLDSGGQAVPATLFSDGIHVSIDPKDDLTAGAMYTLRVGNQLVDMSGTPVTAMTTMFTPAQTRAGGVPTATHVLKTVQDGDPGSEATRAGMKPNTLIVEKEIIGKVTSAFQPTTLLGEIHDPKALGGPIAFTLRKGQRLSTSPLEIKLGGVVPSGLQTGDVMIELLTDATGRLYRNPYQPADQRPENADAPLFVDLSMDVAVYAKDPKGDAVITQTVLGMQASGTAIGKDGALVIETVSSMEFGVLGVTKAPSNLVLSLYTKGPVGEAGGSGPAADTDPPTLVASNPGASEEAAVDQGIELTFSEPIDIARARAGGVKLQDSATNTDIPSVIESHGAGIVVRPLAPLAYGNKIYRVVMSDVADNAGNKASIANLSFTTPVLTNTGIPGMVTAIHPGVPCALTGGTASSPGRCAGGANTDDLYKPFTIQPLEPIDVTFDEPLRKTSISRGTACNQGSVRIEETDAAGACLNVVAGTLITRERSLQFVPDVPWAAGKHYKLTLVSGGNDTCDAGELCDLSSALNFDPLAGMTGGDGGGPNLAIPFTVAAMPKVGTYMMNYAAPFTDVNGSGTLDASELKRQENRVLLRITKPTGGNNTDGSINDANFTGNTCDVAGTPNPREACMYLSGAMPVLMGEAMTNCTLPGGQTAANCVPVYMSAQAMYGTSVTMSAATNLLTITTDTNIQGMRIREGTGGVVGYIVDDGTGKGKLVVSLDLYMDAPDMSILLSSHDLHSKPMSISLEGPVNFTSDGRISIALTNTADVQIVISISGPQSGHVTLLIPKGEMKLGLVSPAPRGVSLQ